MNSYPHWEMGVALDPLQLYHLTISCVRSISRTILTSNRANSTSNNKFADIKPDYILRLMAF